MAPAKPKATVKKAATGPRKKINLNKPKPVASKSSQVKKLPAKAVTRDDVVMEENDPQNDDTDPGDDEVMEVEEETDIDERGV